MPKEKMISETEHLRRVKILEDEIKRLHAIIDQLKEKNNLAIKTALKEAKKNQDMQLLIDKLRNENKQLKHEK